MSRQYGNNDSAPLLEEAWEELEDHAAKREGFFYGPVDQGPIDRAQERLGLDFPQSYRDFLHNYGAFAGPDWEICGLDPAGEEDFPDVVETTQRARVEESVPQDHLVVMEFEDCFFTLATGVIQDGEAPAMIWMKNLPARDQFGEPYTSNFARLVLRVIAES